MLQTFLFFLNGFAYHLQNLKIPFFPLSSKKTLSFIDSELQKSFQIKKPVKKRKRISLAKLTKPKIWTNAIAGDCHLQPKCCTFREMLPAKSRLKFQITSRQKSFQTKFSLELLKVHYFLPFTNWSSQRFRAMVQHRLNRR